MIKVILLLQLAFVVNDSDSAFFDKLFAFCECVEGLEQYSVKYEESCATFMDATPEDVQLDFRTVFIAVDKSGNKTHIRFDLERDGDDTLEPTANIKVLCKVEAKEKKYWIFPRGAEAVTSIRADQLGGIRYRPNSPFILPLLGGNASHHSSWVSGFEKIENLFKVESVGHTQVSDAGLTGWVETKGKTALRIVFDNGPVIKKMSITGYPLHAGLSYETPDASTGWLFKCDSEWDMLGGNNVPVRVEYKSRLGVPGKMKCFESSTVIHWKKTQDDDVFDEGKLALLNNALERRFIEK
jgi:hypothetical protein